MPWATALRRGVVGAVLSMLLAIILIELPVGNRVRSVAAAGDRPANVSVAPTLESAQPSSTYSVTVEGRPVFTEELDDVSYAQFTFTDRARVEVTVPETVERFTLSPRHYGIKTRTSGRTITFTLTSPRKVVLHGVNDVDEKLFIFAESPEADAPRLDDAGVHDVRDHGADPTGSSPVNGAVQRAVAAAARGGGGGVVYLPPGEYLQANEPIRLRSGVTLYLAAGAVLRLDDERHGGGILTEDARDVHVAGRGVIDGNGPAIRDKDGADFIMIDFRDCTGCSVRDVLVRQPPRGNIDFKASPRGRVDNVKIIADVPYVNTDGFSPQDGSDGTVVSDSFAYVTDDCFVPGYRYDLKDVAFVDSVCWNHGSGAVVKATSRETLDSMEHVVFRNISVISAPRLVSLWLLEGGTIEDWTFENFWVENVDDRLFDIATETSNDDSPRHGIVQDITFTDIRIADEFPPEPSNLSGYSADHPVEDVTFHNLVVDGNLITRLLEEHFETNEHTGGLRFTATGRGDS